jgi:hypothetical protein
MSIEDCIVALEAELDRLKVSHETAEDSSAHVYVDQHEQYLWVYTKYDYDDPMILLHPEDIADILSQLSTLDPVEYPINWEGGYCDHPASAILCEMEEFRCCLKPWERLSGVNYRRT